ncbi:sulfatase [Ruficoccus amylovorans]|uniref:Sulfatase n=1 Tax=Ruficoccus amylovorans TaxID=1804625 RepID=A0A842HAD3_9BACT|nr:sulfatase [Ruficoccus amylovorans]MBC2593453.1 sulfatase [Ruficoccus amylovorans]
MNILWIFVEDMSPLLPLWGDRTVATPNIERLAARGRTYINCHSTAPVCSPSRSGLICGCYPTRIGVHNHVSSRPGEPEVFLPTGVRPLPQIMREAGYFTYNLGKDDYNFVYDRAALYDGEFETPEFYGHHHRGYVPFDTREREWAYWRRRRDGQPFFGQIGLWGGKNTRPALEAVSPERVRVPACYPDTPAFRRQIARHYECIQLVDQEVGWILQALEADDLLEDTAIFFFSDHGMDLLRHKQFCYDGGTHVPLVVSVPQDHRAGVTEKRLVSSIDIAAASLELAGLEVPEWMDARNFMTEGNERSCVFSARDRCDFTIDRIRSVRTERYRYIRNYLTDRPLMQPQYRDQTECYLEYRRLWAEGRLNDEQAPYAGDARPAEELYDHAADHDEVHNLVGDPCYEDIREQLSATLERWIIETNDRGRTGESDQQLRALINRWGDERCQAPEYARVKQV